MVEQLCAYGLVVWLCPVGPLVLIGLGIQVGRHGWRHVITTGLLKVFGVPKEGFTS
jgi:hypothetical protein